MGAYIEIVADPSDTLRSLVYWAQHARDPGARQPLSIRSTPTGRWERAGDARRLIERAIADAETAGVTGEAMDEARAALVRAVAHEAACVEYLRPEHRAALGR